MSKSMLVFIVGCALFCVALSGCVTPRPIIGDASIDDFRGEIPVVIGVSMDTNASADRINDGNKFLNEMLLPLLQRVRNDLYNRYRIDLDFSELSAQAKSTAGAAFVLRRRTIVTGTAYNVYLWSSNTYADVTCAIGAVVALTQDYPVGIRLYFYKKDPKNPDKQVGNMDLFYRFKPSELPREIPKF